MGYCETINADKWPKQGYHLGKKVWVWFQNDETFQVEGMVIRDDAEAPWVTIIQLDDSRRVLLGHECTFILKSAGRGKS